jgi:DNA-binding beta-propeller fold protein YncE
MPRESEVEKTARFFRQWTIGTMILVGSLLLLPVMCCGMFGVYGLFRFATKDTKKTAQIASNTTTKTGTKTRRKTTEAVPKAHRLSASVTWVDPGTRQIALRHGGIPTSMMAGNHRFSLAPEAPWPNVLVGQWVECVMEWRNGQWFVSRVNPAPIASFLGISPDFKAYAISEGFLGANGVNVVDLQTGKTLASPKWDRDWGSPLSAAFGNAVMAVVTVRNNSFAVKVFSRTTGELEQNVHGYQISQAKLTADGRFLAITEFRPGNGYHLVLRNIQGKKTVTEVSLGSNGTCTLAVAERHVAACESNSDRITVVETETGKVVKTVATKSFRKRKGFGQGRMPLAISPAGNLLACEAEDAVALYDIDSGNVVKLEGHLDTVRAVAFSPNGEIVASAAKDKTIRFWNVKLGKEVHVLKNLPPSTAELIFPRTIRVIDAAELIFSPDGNRIAVVSLGARKAEIRSVGLK